MQSTYFRKGFGLGREVEPVVQAAYHSDLVTRLRALGNTETFGEGNDSVTIELAESFGFCYGVDRAVDYAYQTRAQFPDRRIYLVGEIIRASGTNSSVPIICMTGLDISPEAARERGCTELLIKPVEPKDLVNAVHRNLVQPPAA